MSWLKNRDHMKLKLENSKLRLLTCKIFVVIWKNNCRKNYNLLKKPKPMLKTNNNNSIRKIHLLMRQKDISQKNKKK